MEFKANISTFFRTVRAYSSRERLVSQVILAILIVVAFKSVFFSGPSVYTEGYVGNIGMLSPVFTDLNEVDRDVSKLIFSGLMRYSPADKAVISDMADLKISEDKKIYTFTLKDHIKWHDGRELTSEDVIFTFHDVIQHEDFANPILKTNFEGVRIEQIDDRTITFTLEKSNSFFITNMTVGILPKHILGEVPVNELLTHNFNLKPIGTGPYEVSGKVKTYSNGQSSVLLKRFRDFYGDKSDILEIRILAYPSAESMVDDHSNLNVISKITGQDADPLRDSGDFELIPFKLPQYTAVFMNMGTETLKEKRLRLGLVKAISKKSLLSVITDVELVDTPLLELDTKNWIYESSEEQANGALYDAGYRYAKEGDKYRLDVDGEEFALRLIARLYPEGSRLYNEHEALINFLINSWADVGIEVSVDRLQPNLFNESIVKRDYDLLLAGQSLGYNLDTFAYWHSSQTDNKGLNLSNYKSFNVDTLLEEIRDAFDAAEKQTKLAELATAMADDVPAIFLYRPIYYLASDGDITGVNVDGLAFPGDRYLRVSEWED